MDVQRESTVFSLTVQPKDVGVAVELLGDIVRNPLMNKNQIEAERDEIYRNASENHKDQMNSTLEAAHYTVRNFTIFLIVTLIYILEL